jgi:hypothetical protein
MRFGDVAKRAETPGRLLTPKGAWAVVEIVGTLKRRCLKGG